MWRRPRQLSLRPKATLPTGEVEYIETILDPFGLRETYAVSGFIDQVTKVRGRWRINFIFDEVKPGEPLLTLLDETNSVMLFSVKIDNTALTREPLFEITTPLRRYLNKQTDGNANTPGLWGALLEEDF